MTSQEKIFIEHCFNGDLKSIKNCIKYKVNIHIEDDWAILIATRNKHSNIVKYLLENGITDISAAKNYILAYAISNYDFDLATYLIQKSDEYKIDTSSVQWAAASGNIKGLELLLPYINDLSWVYCRAAEHGHLETIKFLNDNNIFERDRVMNVVLNCAAQKGQWKILEFLVEEKVVSIDTLAAAQKIKYEDWQKTTGKS
jgi:ankyrin repeat protein